MAPSIVIKPTKKHTATMIFFHGLGDTGNGWASVMADIKPSNVKAICPTAPTIPVTLNGGFRMPSWFDIIALDPDGPEDTEGIKRACEMVHDMIREEIAIGIKPKNVMIGGFSQGGALALYAALKFPEKIGGVVVMSGWLPLHQSFPQAMACPKDIHVLQCHGEQDPLVNFKWGKLTYVLLKGILKHVSLKTYGGLTHSTSEEELDDVRKFVESRLAK